MSISGVTASQVAQVADRPAQRQVAMPTQVNDHDADDRPAATAEGTGKVVNKYA